MQPLLGDLAVKHQTTTMTNRCPQRIYRRFLAIAPAVSRAGQICQRRAIAVIGLKPCRSQLRSRSPGFRRREHPHRTRVTAFQLSNPRPMQITGCLDRDHRLCSIVCSQQTPQDMHSLTRYRQGHRLRVGGHEKLPTGGQESAH
jgi:hypothetical protein